MAQDIEWENTKENFVPLKQGRAAAALVTPISVRKRSNELELAKRSFLEAIEAAEDPLPAWLKYIKWTQEQHTTQGSKVELQQVLEAATKSLSSTGRYHNDVRLLRLWVQYADCLPDPSDVFLYLQDQGIGHEHALLYEAYATYLELKANFSQAELVYQEGVNRLAKPVDRLKQKFAAFQQRMAKRMQRQASEAALGMGPDSTDAAMARATLGPIALLDTTPQLDENGRPIRASRSQHRSAQQQSSASVALGVRPAPPSVASRGSSSSRGPAGAASLWPTPATSQQAPNNLFAGLGPSISAGGQGSSSNVAPRQLEVLVDEEFGPSGGGAIPTAFLPSLQQHGALPGFAAITKENSSQPAIWNGTKLKQQAMFTGPTATKLEVYEDEDSEEGGEATAGQPAQQQQQPGSLRQHLDAPPAPAAAGSSAAALQGSNQQRLGGDHALRGQSHKQQHPLTAMRDSALSASAHSRSGKVSQNAPNECSSSVPAPSAAAPSAAGPAGSAPRGFDESLLVGPDGTEVSFEEIRAAAWRAQQKKKQQQQQQLLHQQQQAVVQMQPRQAEQQQTDRATEPQQHKQKQQQLLQQQPTSNVQLNAARPTQQGLQQQRQRAVAPTDPTVITVNTRAALESLNDMFSSDMPTATLPRAAVAAASSGTSSGNTSRHGAAATSSRRPFGLPAAAPEGPDAGGVTINTRAAFEAMNGMFGSSDDTTTMHGLGRPAAAGRKSMLAAAAADAGGVTMNTRAALEAMNGMFSGGDDTTTMHGFGRAAAAGHKPMAAAAADAGGVTMNTRAALEAMNGMFGGGDDTTTMHGFGRAAAGRQAAGMEPTVTVNTRAAFDYMNGVFGGSGDVTMGHTAAMGGGRIRGARGTSRLSVAPAAAAAASNSFSIYEDTEFVGSRLEASGAAGAPDNVLGLYEDTEFVGSKLAAAAGGNRRRSSMATAMLDGSCRGPGPAPAGSGGSGSGGGLCLYEDTEFITRQVGGSAAAAAAGGGGDAMGGLSVYEDTEFITQSVAAAGGGGGGDGGGGPSGTASLLHRLDRLSLANEALNRGQGSSNSLRDSGGNAAAGSGPGPAGGMCLYEDTEFITQPVGVPAGASGSNSADAVGISSSSGTGGLDIYADTEFLTKPVNAAAGAAATAASGLHRRPEQHAECSFDEDSTAGLLRVKENLPAGVSSRQQQSQRSRGLALGPVPAAAAGCSSSSAGMHQHSYGGAGPSRFGPGSVPSSPGSNQPGALATTPGRPPRTPGTPGGGPWARPLDTFEVMESPAVRAALAGRQHQLPGSMCGSPAGGLTASPGMGAHENLPAANGDGKEQQPLAPRSLTDRAVRAAALQPLSASRAELLGVQLDPTAAGEYEVEDDEQEGQAVGREGWQRQQEQHRAPRGGALRSLNFAHGKQ